MLKVKELIEFSKNKGNVRIYIYEYTHTYNKKAIQNT